MTNPTENNDLAILTPEQARALPALIQQMMGPIVETMSKLLEHNDRLEALERQIRLNTPVTPQQVRYMNDAIRARARELLFKREVEDARSIKKLGNSIRKDVLARYGIGALHEIPKHEYTVTMMQIGMWSDALRILDCVKEARARAEKECYPAESTAGAPC